MIILHIIFWLSIALIAHSYLIFPWLIALLAKNKKENDLCYTFDELPAATVVMAVFNEEKVLTQKLDSIVASDYPKDKLTVLIGSDGSTDGTNRILESYSKKHAYIRPGYAEERKGKPAMINRLVGQTEDEVVILTDANVYFDTRTLSGMIRHFKNKKIGSVGVNIVNRNTRRDGVSIQENAFVTRENTIKYHEGLIWGATIGQFGAVYAIRKSLYKDVPEGFAVDDFFISMQVLRQGKQAIVDIETIAYEDVSNIMSEEYRRKVRISAGNYQNLAYFRRELRNPWTGVSFAFWSHKVIRWLGPFLLITAMLSNIFLLGQSRFYQYTALLIGILLLLPIIDVFLGKIGIHIVFLRFIRHFISMNLALLQGFIKYIRGIRNHVWEPTKR